MSEELEAGYYWATDSAGDRKIVEISNGEAYCFGVEWTFEVEEFTNYVPVKGED